MGGDHRPGGRGGGLWNTHVSAWLLLRLCLGFSFKIFTLGRVFELIFLTDTATPGWGGGTDLGLHNRSEADSKHAADSGSASSLVKS